MSEAIAGVKHAVLVITGDGVGNAIQSTPLMTSLHDAGFAVDVFIPEAPEDVCALFRGGPGIRTVATGPGPFDGRAYVAVVGNWMKERWVARFHSSDLSVAGRHPIRHGLRESVSHWEAGQPIHRQAHVPRTWIVYTKPSPIEAGGPKRVAMHWGGKTNGFWLNKRYPHYDRVVEQLVECGVECHVFGGPTDNWPVYREGVIAHQQRTLSEVATEMAGCDAFIGNDAGLAHMAAAIGLPTAVVFGPTDVTKNLPPSAVAITSGPLACRPCQSRQMGTLPNGRRCHIECMANLKPEGVRDTALKLLGIESARGDGSSAQGTSRWNWLRR